MHPPLGSHTRWKTTPIFPWQTELLKNSDVSVNLPHHTSPLRSCYDPDPVFWESRFHAEFFFFFEKERENHLPVRSIMLLNLFEISRDTRVSNPRPLLYPDLRDLPLLGSANPHPRIGYMLFYDGKPISFTVMLKPSGHRLVATIIQLISHYHWLCGPHRGPSAVKPLQACLASGVGARAQGCIHSNEPTWSKL